MRGRCRRQRQKEGGAKERGREKGETQERGRGATEIEHSAELWVTV